MYFSIYYILFHILTAHIWGNIYAEGAEMAQCINTKIVSSVGEPRCQIGF